MASLIVLLPAIVPVVALSHSIYRKRLRSAARAFRCLSCSAVLGLESIRLADAAWDAHMRDLGEKYPASKFRVVRHIHAMCPACGARYAFLERERTFVPASDPVSPPAGQEDRHANHAANRSIGIWTRNLGSDIASEPT
jgi:hypothetical protein